MFPWLRALLGPGNPELTIQAQRAGPQFSTALYPGVPYNTGAAVNANAIQPQHPVLPGSGQVGAMPGRFGGLQSLGPPLVVASNGGPTYYNAPAGWMRGTGDYRIPKYRNLSSAPGYAGSPTVTAPAASMDIPYLQQLYARAPSNGL